MTAEKFQHYENQKVMTASPAMLVFMLYEKAIGCLKESVKAIESVDVNRRWKANKRAMAIIEHLKITLNMEAGGEIATNLDSIFGYLLRELPKIDLNNDPAPARDAIKLLAPLCESWRQIADQGEAATHQAMQAAKPKTTCGPALQSGAPGRAMQPNYGGGNTDADKASGSKPPGIVTLTA